MGKDGARTLLGKVIFRGTIVLQSGLHIGGSKESMEIGGLDLPVIKDSATREPYIPGSSLKGKLRSTLEKIGTRIKGGQSERLTANRNIGGRGRNDLFIHCCDHIDHALQCEVCRIFGSSGDDAGVPRGQKAANLPSLLMVRDCPLSAAFLGEERVEIKTETGIDRLNMAANPRQVERVVPNTSFDFEMVYSVEAITLDGKKKATFPETLQTDLENLLNAMAITQKEGLGGYSSRGYGKISFSFTEFQGKSLDYYKGKTVKERGEKSQVGFTLEVARSKIEEIVKFLKEESADVLPR